MVVNGSFNFLFYPLIPPHQHPKTLTSKGLCAVFALKICFFLNNISFYPPYIAYFVNYLPAKEKCKGLLFKYYLGYCTGSKIFRFREDRLNYFKK